MDGGTKKSDQAIEVAIKPYFGVFVRRTALVFFALFVILVYLGLAPRGAEEVNNALFSMFIREAPIVELSSVPVRSLAPASGARSFTPGSFQYNPSEPFSLSAPKIGLNWKVVNTSRADLSGLDQALLSGPVRFPGSGAFGSVQDMFIFGHSSHLPVVRNHAYRAFNDVERLTTGDLVYLRGATQELVYRVTSNVLTKASEASVDIGSRKKRLVLVTCNNFGAKEDRYIVTADFVESRPLAN